MKSPENMIVTVQVDTSTYDMELPAFMPVQELASKIVETLRCMAPGQYAGLNGLALSCRGKVLPKEKTLASCGVWDGSVLSCRRL